MTCEKYFGDGRAQDPESLMEKGNRFGFVRFNGVKVPETLEKQLDTTHIGNMKLHMNVPKYSI